MQNEGTGSDDQGANPASGESDQLKDIHLVTVYTVQDAAKAEMIRNALVDNGIPCEVGGESQALFTGALPIELMVREQDVEDAKKVISTQIAKP